MRLALIGNCQVQTLAVLADAMLENAELCVLDYSDPASRAEATRIEFTRLLDDCDLILAQTATLSHTNETELRARFGARVVTIANFYFRGLFPDSCYVGDFHQRLDQPCSVNSMVILDSFRRGLSVEAAVRSFAPDTYARLDLFDAWDSSMAEMWAREANGVVAVPGAAMMEEACHLYPAFLTMNHPSLPLMAEYLAMAFRHLGVAHRQPDVARMPDPLKVHDTTPVIDLVAEHYRLPYRTSQTWKVNSLSCRFVGLEEMVARFYRTYAEAAPGRLLVHSPTDAVRRLAADPALAYLVDERAPAPPAALNDAATSGLRQASMASALDEVAERRAWLLQASADRTTGNLRELTRYMHELRSFMQVADPKIERLVYDLPRAERIEARLAELSHLSHATPRGLSALAWLAAAAVSAIIGAIVAAGLMVLAVA